MNDYCNICGNEKVPTHGSHCAKCDAQVVKGWLAEGYRRWTEAGERWSKCCGNLNYDFGLHASPEARAFGTLSFHGKYMDGEHKGTHVEYGVSFGSEGATTYYLRDFDSYRDSEEYGERIAYLDPDFWNKLDAQLACAPEAAYNADLRSCECGYHYVAGNGPCCVQCGFCGGWVRAEGAFHNAKYDHAVECFDCRERHAKEAAWRAAAEES